MKSEAKQSEDTVPADDGEAFQAAAQAAGVAPPPPPKQQKPTKSPSRMRIAPRTVLISTYDGDAQNLQVKTNLFVEGNFGEALMISIATDRANAERRAQTVQGRLRIARNAFEHCISERIPNDHVMLMWLIQHVAS